MSPNSSFPVSLPPWQAPGPLQLLGRREQSPKGTCGLTVLSSLWKGLISPPPRQGGPEPAGLGTICWVLLLQRTAEEDFTQTTVWISCPRPRWPDM